MADPPADRLPDTEEEQPELYEKDKGSAQIHGQIFEYKFCSLVFLRAKNKGYKFKLASNMEGYGKFDDVVVEYLDNNSRKFHIFLQLKSKMKQKITMKQLLAEKGDFSLRKYYESYIQIEDKFNCSEGGVKMDGRIDESLFIIYTNTDVVQELKSYNVLDFREEEFLMTGGTVLQFNEEEHKNIYEHLQELPKHREFLSRIRICYSQADEKEMECHIKPELQHSMKLPERDLDLTYKNFLLIIQNWWQNCNYFLQDTNCKENDPLLKTSEEVGLTLVAKILDQRKTELDELSITYKQSAIKDIQQLTELHKVVLIYAPGRSTTLTADKIHQMLSATKHIILSLQQLILYKTEVMLAWKHTFNVLVLESDSSTEVSPDLFIELSVFLNKSVAEKKFIFISKSMGNIQQIHELRNMFHANLTEEYDDCKFRDIVTESRMLILERKVNFQGVEVKLSTIVKNDGVGVLNALDCDSISLLLENEMPSIGMRIEDTVKYYVDRTLQFRKQTNTRFPAQGEIQHASRGNILQEIRDGSPHLEENWVRETDTVWKPSTLIDGEGRIILIADEPGMGKSTFLSHLAKETRERHPELWIVRININNYTRILKELQTNGCDEKGVIKLLTEAAQIKKCDGVLLEERLYNYTYNSTGNMIVLIDGVDEVSPHYTEEVIQVLKILSKTKIKRIWVTSRNSVRDRLETEFQFQSYSLVPFSEEDQEQFLVKFWKETCPGIEDDYLKDLANRVVKLSTEHLTVQDKNFMEIPLQSWLLAEMFKGNLKQCTTEGTVELPEHINVVLLYDFYVDKKWDIYLSDKKKSDRTNVNALTDDSVLHKSFIHNHMVAALVAIFSTLQLEKLTDKTIADGVRAFLQKITEGIEKTGIIIDVIEGRPVFQHRTLAEYLAARWLCENFQNGQIFMRDHLFESVFHVVRGMVDRILADKYPLHEAVLNSDVRYVARLLERKESITQKDRGGRTPLHVAVSCRSPELIKLLLEHGADGRSVDTFLGLSPVEYAIRIADWEVLSLMMEKRSDIREQVLNGTNQENADCIISALRAAAQYGHNNLLKYLISKGANVNAAGKYGYTLLHLAGENGHIEVVRELLNHGANVNTAGKFGDTPLYISGENGHVEVVRELLNHGANVNTANKDGDTPLYTAGWHGHVEVVRELLNHGANVNTANKDGDTPLYTAGWHGHVEVVRELLNHGANVNTANERGDTPLHVAGENRHVEVVREFLNRGANMNTTNKSGDTPLYVAGRNGHVEVVRELINHGANVNTADRKGCTPLYVAGQNGHVEVVRELMNHGANVNTAKKGFTPLHVASLNGHIEVVQELLNHGANVNISKNCSTPLHVAGRNGHVEVVRELLNHGANVYTANKRGDSPLHVAGGNGHVEVVRELLNHGANVNTPKNRGGSPLHVAGGNGHVEVVRELLKHGANVNTAKNSGDTPLHVAGGNGHVEVVRELLKHGANVNTANKDGFTPQYAAGLNGHVEVVRELINNGAQVDKSMKAARTFINPAAEKGYLNLIRDVLK